MREYLFELRKKANKSQAEIDKIFIEKYNLKIGYSSIELGVNWKDLSGDRAIILAGVLETTPEYIISCDKKYGGYVGKHHMLCIDNPHNVRNGRNFKYDAPLSKEEQSLAIEYYPYAQKIIGKLRNQEYYCFLGNVMTYEDFYDVGIIAFLRCIKKLSIKRIEDDSFMSDLEEPDFFYRHCFAKAIKAAYYKYIRAELTLRRKDYHSADILDATIQNKDGDGSEKYNFVPSKDTPIPIISESSWTLDVLYRYLNGQQIIACKLLISGWTPPEIVKGKYATKRDIGIIRFYLLQFKQYGKIIWRTEIFKSDAPNVHYDFTTNKWVVGVMYKAKKYCLGEYPDLNIALDLHNLLHLHLNKGDFLQWYEDHMRPNVYTTKAFTYPLPDNPETENIEIIEPIKKFRGGTKIVHATKDNPKGITYSKSRKTYTACLGEAFHLGCYKTFDEALNARNTAEVHYFAGDIDQWYSEFKSKKAKEKIKYTRLDKRNRNGKTFYAVTRNYQRKHTHLGQYSYEDALLVKSLADKHIDDGDFDEWAKVFYEDYKNKLKVKQAANLQKVRDKIKYTSSYIAVYVICKYTPENYILLCFDANGAEHTIGKTVDVEEAYKTMDLANEHIEAGDFDVWLADYKNIKTEVSQ